MLVLNTKGGMRQGEWGMACVTPPPARPAADCGERMGIGGPRPPACNRGTDNTIQRWSPSRGNTRKTKQGRGKCRQWAARDNGQ